MARPAPEGGKWNGPWGAGLMMVNEASQSRRVAVSVARDGITTTETVRIGAGEVRSIGTPAGVGPLSIEVNTDRGEHASLTATRISMVVLREGSVLVAE